MPRLPFMYVCMYVCMYVWILIKGYRHIYCIRECNVCMYVYNCNVCVGRRTLWKWITQSWRRRKSRPTRSSLIHRLPSNHPVPEREVGRTIQQVCVYVCMYVCMFDTIKRVLCGKYVVCVSRIYTSKPYIYECTYECMYECMQRTQWRVGPRRRDMLSTSSSTRDSAMPYGEPCI